MENKRFCFCGSVGCVFFQLFADPQETHGIHHQVGLYVKVHPLNKMGPWADRYKWSDNGAPINLDLIKVMFIDLYCTCFNGKSSQNHHLGTLVWIFFLAS